MSGIRAQQLLEMFAGGSRRLAEFKDAVDSMNVFPVPDGDTGSNMSRTLEKMEASLPDGLETPKEVAEAAAKGALLGARGNSGVILSQIIKGFAQGAWSGLEMGAPSLAAALMEASDMAYQAVIKPVEGTILTVAKEAAQAAALSVSAPDTPVEEVLGAALMQARLTLSRTPEMLPKLKNAGVVDAGGQGLVYFLEGMMMVLQGDMVVKLTAAEETPAPHVESDLRFRYCTEVIVCAERHFALTLREKLSSMSDSLIVVGDAGAVKVHAHTSDPGKLISMALEGGELLDVKVDNMALQHRETIPEEHEKAKASAAAIKAAAVEAQPEIAVVAVSPGAGFTEIYKSLGVAAVVEGGQTMNPSIGEIAEAINSVDAEHVVVLPGNGNIILAAEKAAENSNGKTVRVIPTKNIPQGFNAMLELEGRGTPAERVEKMLEAAKNIDVVEITSAVRNTTAGELEISEGDVIAIINGELKINEKDLSSVYMASIRALAENGAELVTAYRGADVSEREAETLAASVGAVFPDIELETLYGGQPHYHFIISGE